jgi:phage host-nuclease inhibitor protein Gam
MPLLRAHVADLSRELARLRAAAMDVLHALPEDQGPALHRLKYEMAGRGQRRIG